MAYDPQRHHRRSIRLPQYDYAQPGAYFVTLSVHRRTRCLCCIQDAKVCLSSIGSIVDEQWRAIPYHAMHIALDAFVLMPDHMHGIIQITRYPDSKPTKNTDYPKGTTPGSLPAIMQNFKSTSTRRVNAALGTPGIRLWQEDYYERIIRNDAEFQRIRQYILNNPARWRT
jgi:putative transposase